jgi:uncharacterized protein with PIN domain
MQMGDMMLLGCLLVSEIHIQSSVTLCDTCHHLYWAGFVFKH